jgi:hypothetical protein
MCLFFVMLQEDIEDEQLKVFLHLDNAEERTEEELKILEEYSICFTNDDEAGEVIKKFLRIST